MEKMVFSDRMKERTFPKSVNTLATEVAKTYSEFWKELISV